MGSSPPVSRWPTRGAWAAVALVAALRAIPFFVTLAAAAPEGERFVHVGYVPKDFLAYVALIHEPGAAGLLADPFTTAPQLGRFVQLMHQAWRAIHQLTGLSGFALLELSRPLFLALLLLALWPVLQRALTSQRERTWAVWLIFVAGGFDVLVAGIAEFFFTGDLAAAVRLDLWSLKGFDGFEASYNPLWVAGLGLQVVVLRLFLDPSTPRTPRRSLGGGLLLALLWFTHQYSALATLAALAAAPIVDGLLERRLDRRSLGLLALGLAPSLSAIGAVTAWQLGDPAFAAVSGHVMGAQAFSPLWLPVTLGAVGYFALRGFVRWHRDRHPWRGPLGAWIVATVLIAALPFLNGYHFAPYVWIPVAIAAAPALVATLDRWRAAGAGALRPLALGLALFGSPALVTADAVRTVLSHHTEASFLDLCAQLSHLPQGNVLAPAFQGNVIPALSPQRVWVGQWFLTPRFDARSAEAARLLSGVDAPGLTALVARERIRYVVVADPSADAVEKILSAGAPAEVRRSRFGRWTLLDLGPKESP